MSNSYIGWALHEGGSVVRRVGLHPCGSLNSGLFDGVIVLSYLKTYCIRRILGECFYLLTSTSVSLALHVVLDQLITFPALA
ncbi:hypothetical protein EV363DRAFT_1184930 [Boletus edulis]|nr:hypothetical protein EV363DRAFT_1184930 [Boletus edulis]